MKIHALNQLRYYTHSILFCVIPVVFLYAQNINELYATDIVRSIMFIAVAIVLIFAFIRLFTNNTAKSTIFVTISIVLLFSYGFLRERASDVLGIFGVQDYHDYDGPIALALILLFWCCLSYANFTRNAPNAVHDFFNVMGVTMLTISLSTIGFEFVQSPTSDSPSLADTELPFAPLEPADDNTYPDIIYIVPDRYPNNYVARKYFDFDNQQFIHELTDRGFFVAEKAHANYLKTALSLAATLNLQHITSLSDIYGEDTGRMQPLYDLVRDHLVQQSLRERGYRFIHMGSWWPPTAFNKNAHENFPGTDAWRTRFETALLGATPVVGIWNTFQRWWEPELSANDNAGECSRVKKKIEYLKHVGGGKEPVFVFAHVLVPHDPIKFDADGHCIKGPQMTKKKEWEQFKKGFVGQMEYINSAIVDVFDHQLKNNKNKLVFVVQSDEGPFPMSLRLDGNLNWETTSIDDIFMKFGILNAFYFHNSNYSGLSEHSSPVNNFRVIFNNTLGFNLPLLEDRAYIFKDTSHVFKFTDVTDTVRRLTEN